MNKYAHGTGAFSLVEVALALGVTAFCLIAILGLLPIGLKSDQAAFEETAATGILSAVAADLRATPSTSPAGLETESGQFAIPIPGSPLATTPASVTLFFTREGQRTNSLDAASRYRLTLTFPLNSSGAKTATLVNLQVSWPAAVAPEKAAGRATMLLALDRN